MQFIDLHRQRERIKVDIEVRIQTVLSHGKFILGPEIQELEQKLADFAGVPHCITCSSGSDALLMALMAWGIGPGDAVYTTPFTFIATAEVVALLGATPVFVDIDPKTYNIDPHLLETAVEQTERENKLRPRAVITVDLFGLPADYGAIEEIARRRSLPVLEDAAQSFGASVNGRRTCSFGTAAATSFFPAKPLGCYGDGGAVFVHDDALAAELRSIRVHGQGSNKYDNVRLGINGRFDTLQAAVVLAKLSVFPDEIEKRNRIARTYSEKLGTAVTVPHVPQGYESVWAQYSVLSRNADHRSELQEKLKKEGVPTAVYYPKPLHLQPAFKNLSYSEGDFPVSEDVSSRIFSLPMHPYLTDDEIDTICRSIAG